jgi:hypothetical protein
MLEGNPGRGEGQGFCGRLVRAAEINTIIAGFSRKFLMGMSANFRFPSPINSIRNLMNGPIRF